MARFPEDEWIQALMAHLNEDEQYAQVARNWEGDLLFRVDPDGILEERILIYMDLWHGKCRSAEFIQDPSGLDPAFELQAPFGNFVRVLQGELHPMQAMLTRKLHVKGDMIYMMRNLPTVLEFVRCCQEVTTSVLGT